MALVGLDGVLLTTSLVTARTIGLLIQTKRIVMTFCNQDSANRIIGPVHFVEKGGTAADSNMVIQSNNMAVIKPGQTHIYAMDQFLNPEDFIQWKADAASVVSARISTEEQASSALFNGGGSETGSTSTTGKAIEIPAAITKAHTVASGNQGVFASFVFLNRDSSSRLITVEYVPNGQSPANAYKLIEQAGGAKIAPGETQIFQSTQVLNSGDMIYWSADVASKVTGRVSIQEAAA